MQNITDKVKIYSGVGSVRKYLPECIDGKSILIVTGKNSAKVSGALSDVVSVLESKSIAYTVYDGVRENPSVSSAMEAGAIARLERCDTVIGIGGGSAIDAAKAAAAFAADPDLFGPEIFTADIEKTLPVIAVPTTAGTGSEANRYSVLTLDGGLKKQTYKSDAAYPVCAFLDAKYTVTISDKGAVSCALDAFSHCIESYLSPKATDVSRELAKEGARGILSVIMKKSDGFTETDRETLLYASSMGGAAIDITGTGFTHPMGYSITLSDGIPHGQACGLFISDYIFYNYKTDEGRCLLDEFFAFAGYDMKDAAKRIAELSRVSLSLEGEEREEYIDRIASAGNFKNSPYVLSRSEMSEIYARLFSEKQ